MTVLNVNLNGNDIVEICKDLTEKARRLFLGRCALSRGYGGIKQTAKEAKVSRSMVSRGVIEVKAGEVYREGDRSRRPGGGRKKAEETHRKNMEKEAGSGSVPKEHFDLKKLVQSIVDSWTYGDPMSDRIYCKATLEKVRDEVMSKTNQYYSKTTIRKILRALNYKQMKNRKFNQAGKKHEKRHEQYDNIQNRIGDYIGSGDPVLSLDTKAKEKLGDFINAGLEWRRSKDPRRVLDHDFAFRYKEIYPNGCPLVPEEMMGSAAIAIPYGVYCVNNNQAYVSVGISSDTSEFAGDSVKAWWMEIGKEAFPNAKRILILADGGGSNRSRGSLFKIALQQLSDDIGLEIEVCHYAPGCSKYNPIEHRLWPHVTHAWEGKPLENLETIAGYVNQAKTKKGLTVKCEVNSRIYLTEKKKAEMIKIGKMPSGIINAKEMEKDLCCTYAAFDDESMRSWNYTIKPHPEHNRWVDYRMSGMAS